MAPAAPARHHPPLVGVDGARGGWVFVQERAGVVSAGLAADVERLVATVGADALIAIDVPIGLPDAGPRAADRAARRFLGHPRGSSVFPAPVRSVLGAASYPEACARHAVADGRRMSRQAYAILPKVAEVDAALRRHAALRTRVHEVHPEVSFARWAGAPLTARKAHAAGRAARRALIDARWPGAVDAATAALRKAAPGARRAWATDDLLDAFAALWTAHRLAAGTADVLPSGEVPRDAVGLPMTIAG